MPHSIFMGRPMPAPGEPLFLEDDTAAAIALAEEEQDSCPACGLPRAWCREGGLGDVGRFDIKEDTCWATYRVALRREALEKDSPHSPTRQARQITPRFRKGYLPDFGAGLNLD